MASLIPCSVCQRHIRRQEAQCPFCGAERTPLAGPFREVVIPRDATRATIFALGLSLAGQACGGQTDGNNDPSPSGAGASTGIGTGGGSNSTVGSGGTFNRGTDNVPDGILTPPYGGIGRPPPAPDTDGGAGSSGIPVDARPPDAGANDAGSTDAGPDDAGN